MGDSDSRTVHSALIFGFIFFVILLSHLQLLHLPYFWDEAGYYIPAARDLWLTGTLIPHSTPSNAHPPLVMAYLSFIWQVAGFSPMVTRTAMVLVAAFTLTGLFRLAEGVANFEIAAASTLCVAIYPVFFVQSSLAQLDLAAAGAIFWGLRAYFREHWAIAIIWFSLAALAKETAILIPTALFLWELAGWLLRRWKAWPEDLFVPWRGWKSLMLVVSAIPLAAWYAYHYSRTGHVFGNPEFFRYNVQATMSPLRIVLALLMRLWQMFGYMNLWLLTAAAVLAMWRPPLIDRHSSQSIPRDRISLRVQLAFLAIAAFYAVAMAIVGGAVLARYMIPVMPLVVILLVSTLRRRIRMWRWIVALTVVAFGVALFVNPPYGFTLEDNLAYRDYILLHREAEHLLEIRYPGARILTAWPASDEISQPFLGYVSRPFHVARLENFSQEQLMTVAGRHDVDVALIFSTKYRPPSSLLENWQAWQRVKARFFGYHRDLQPEAALRFLGGEAVDVQFRKGQWIAVIDLRKKGAD